MNSNHFNNGNFIYEWDESAQTYRVTPGNYVTTTTSSATTYLPFTQEVTLEYLKTQLRIYTLRRDDDTKMIRNLRKKIKRREKGLE